ncbi:MAG: hypothetical protein WC678_01340 [Parcubacteria group bacterium]|jgi:hypothetical protein
MKMSKITLMLAFVLLIASHAHATRWADVKSNIEENFEGDVKNIQCDCAEAKDVKKEFTDDDDKEIWWVIDNGTEDDFSELITRYNQKSTDNHAEGNIFGKLFYKSIELMIIKHYSLRFPENFSPEFFSGSESVLLDEELQKVLNSLEELEKNCFFKTSIK